MKISVTGTATIEFDHCCSCGTKHCSNPVVYSHSLPNEPGEYVVRAEVDILPGDSIRFEIPGDFLLAEESGEIVWVIAVTEPNQSLSVEGCGALSSVTISPHVIDTP